MDIFGLSFFWRSSSHFLTLRVLLRYSYSELVLVRVAENILAMCDQSILNGIVTRVCTHHSHLALLRPQPAVTLTAILLLNKEKIRRRMMLRIR